MTTGRINQVAILLNLYRRINERSGRQQIASLALHAIPNRLRFQIKKQRVAFFSEASKLSAASKFKLGLEV
jgi:hypothetical protein